MRPMQRGRVKESGKGRNEEVTGGSPGVAQRNINNKTLNKLQSHDWFIFLSSQSQRKLLGGWVIHSRIHSINVS